MLLLPGIIYLSAKSIIDVGSSTDLFGSISRREKFDKMACAFIKLAIFCVSPAAPMSYEMCSDNNF